MLLDMRGIPIEGTTTLSTRFPCCQPRESSRMDYCGQRARLSTLREEADAVIGRIRELRERLARKERGLQGRTPALPFSKEAAAPGSQDEKVALFRTLFRGRNDVFPRLWESAKSGKKGYSPACDNEWVRGLCSKPQVKCGECPNQAPLPGSCLRESPNG